MSEKITHVRLTRAYGKNPDTGKPYPINTVLEVGKELPESELERVLKLRAAIPFEKQSGYVLEVEHNRLIEGMKQKTGEYQKQALENKELVIAIVKKINLDDLTIELLKQVATLIGLSGLGNVNKEAIVTEIQNALKKD